MKVTDSTKRVRMVRGGKKPTRNGGPRHDYLNRSGKTRGNFKGEKELEETSEHREF
jgi:hypothetical protein